jgi:16S rRNA (cytosine967-C5)-methyltransferase
MQLSSLLGHVQELLRQIVPSRYPPDSLIDSFFRSRKYLGSHDRRFIAETVYGVLRHRRRAEAILHAATDGAPVSSHELLPIAFLLRIQDRDLSDDLSNVPRVSSDLLQRIKNVPLPPPADEVERIGLEYSFPEWMIIRFLAQYGASEAENILRSLNEQAPMTLRVNTISGTVEECRSSLRSEGVETSPTRFSSTGLIATKRLNVFGLQSFRKGLFEVQDEGSQLLCLLLDPKPTFRVLDACAGAGGKSLALSAIMKNRGEIVATDVNERRLNELRKRMRRAGAHNIRPRVVDDLTDLREDFTGFFDLILVDAPCSGIGTIRRNPGMKWSVTENTVREVCEKQRVILESVKDLLKPNGNIAYATCTMLKEENEEVVESFLSEHSEFRVVDPRPMLEKQGLANAQSEHFIKLMPHVHGTDGFFCAILQLVM